MLEAVIRGLNPRPTGLTQRLPVRFVGQIREVLPHL